MKSAPSHGLFLARGEQKQLSGAISPRPRMEVFMSCLIAVVLAVTGCGFELPEGAG